MGMEVALFSSTFTCLVRNYLLWVPLLDFLDGSQSSRHEQGQQEISPKILVPPTAVTVITNIDPGTSSLLAVATQGPFSER